MNNSKGLEGFVFAYYPERHAGIVAQLQSEGKLHVARTTCSSCRKSSRSRA